MIPEGRIDLRNKKYDNFNTQDLREDERSIHLHFCD